jgi:hypothetical protein
MPDIAQLWKSRVNISHAGANAQSSGHTTSLVTKKNKTSPEKPAAIWVHKEFKDPRLAQFEAVMASWYGMIESQRTPKVRVVYDDDGIPEATISKRFVKFKSLKAYLGANFGASGYEAETDKKLEALIDGGFAEVSVLSWHYEEDDGHLDNYGVIEYDDGSIDVTRIDFDMSGMSVVGQPDLRGDRWGSTLFDKPVEKRFLQTDRDLNTYPICADFDACYWLTKLRPTLLAITDHAFTANQVAVFRDKLHKHPRFLARSFLTKTKITLCPDSAYEARIKAHMTDADLQNKLKKFITKKNDLRQLLMKNEKFRCVWAQLLQYPLLAKKSIREFFEQMDTQNAYYARKPKLHSLQIDVAAMKEAYYLFCRDMMGGGWLRSINLLKEVNKKLASTDSLSPNDKTPVDKTPVSDVFSGAEADLMKAGLAFLALKKISVSDIDAFLCNTYVLLDAVKQECGSLAHSKEFFEEMDYTLQQFIHHCAFLDEAPFLKFHDLLQSSFILASHDRFESVPVFKCDDDMLQVITAWLRTIDFQGALVNKKAVIDIFTKLSTDYLQANVSYFQMVVSITGFWSSAPAVPTLHKELSDISISLRAAETPDQFCGVIADLMMVHRPGMKEFKNTFFSKISELFGFDFSKKSLADQVCDSPMLAEHFYAQSKLTPAEMNSVAEFLSCNFQRYHQESQPGFRRAGVDDVLEWQ